MTATGRRIAQFIRPGARLPTLSAKEAAVLAGDHIDVTVPVVQNGQDLGTVSLRASTEPPQRRIARYAGLVLLVTMGALVIAVLSFTQAALIAARRASFPASMPRLQEEMAERQKTEEALRQSHKMEAVGQLVRRHRP